MNLPPGAVPLPKNPTLMDLLELHVKLDLIERERATWPLHWLVVDEAVDA